MGKCLEPHISDKTFTQNKDRPRILTSKGQGRGKVMKDTNVVSLINEEVIAGAKRRYKDMQEVLQIHPCRNLQTWTRLSVNVEYPDQFKFDFYLTTSCMG